MSDDQPPWSYALRATELLRGASSVVDMGAAGVSVSWSYATPGPHVTATEEHPPNFQLATDRLAPLESESRRYVHGDRPAAVYRRGV